MSTAKWLMHWASWFGREMLGASSRRDRRCRWSSAVAKMRGGSRERVAGRSGSCAGQPQGRQQGTAAQGASAQLSASMARALAWVADGRPREIQQITPTPRGVHVCLDSQDSD